MVAKLVSVEDFAVRAGLGSVDDLDETITTKAQASIEAATIHLISILRTEFDQTAHTDRYYVDHGERPFVGEFPRFYFTQSFVTTATSALVVRTNEYLPDLSSADAIDQDYFVMDADKGPLLITGTDRLPINFISPVSGNRYFAQIEYTAGFASTADAFGTIYQSVPDFLVEAAIILAKSIFDTGQPCKSDERNSQGCPCSIEALVSRYMRFLPSALKPMS